MESPEPKSCGRVAVLLALTLGPVAMLRAQQVQVGLGGRIVAGAAEEETAGSNLVLPESADLNRLLSRATEFFARTPARWEDGIELIQGLLEGTSKIEKGPDHLNDPHYSVYSGDQRLYVPFTEYCQSLLASLPAEGLAAYRALYDGRARSAFEKAAGSLDHDALEGLAGRYFATSSGPEILSLLADLSTLAGDLPKAVHLRQRLLDSYPDLGEEMRRKLRVRQLQAYALLGEGGRFEDVYTELRAQDPEASFRILGELVPVAKLPETEAFAIREAPTRAAGTTLARTAGNHEGFPFQALLPLWRFDMSFDDPYLISAKGNRNVQFWIGGQGALYTPHNKDARPGVLGTTVDTPHGRAFAVKDHEKLVLLDLVSGKKLDQDEDPGRRDKPVNRQNQNNQMQERLPSTDFVQQRIQHIGHFLYLPVQHKVVPGQADKFPYKNDLLRYDLDSGRFELLPSTGSGAEEVFFEGPPMPYGEWLFAPCRRKNSFCIARLRASDGVLDEVVTVHTGGSQYLRPPAVPVVIVGHQLLHLTNGGAVASFSLPDLELRWVRRYETQAPKQEPKRQPRVTNRMWSGVRTQRLPSWEPVDPIVVGNRIVVAPVDSDALLCIEVQSGELEWILPREEDRGVEFHYVLGPDDGRIWLVGDHLQCVEVRTGRRLWEVELEHGTFLQKFGSKVEGRGVILGREVHLPLASGKVVALSADDGHELGSYELPALLPGEESIKPPFNLQVDGPVLLAVSEAQVCAFATPETLMASSTGGLDRVRRMLAAQRPTEACAALGAMLRAGQPAGEDNARARRLYLRLVGELSAVRRQAGDIEGGLKLLDEAASVLGLADPLGEPALVLARIRMLEDTDRQKELRRLRDVLASQNVEIRQRGEEER
ncbi:MAG: PQQ-binding-like beta-propeller repeat protein [Planctomycetota bacterium]